MSGISGISSGMTSGEIGTNYLTLLVTQLKNQNPLEPMNNNEMSAQLAQLAQLENTEALRGDFAKVLQATQASQASGLIGKTVAYIPQGAEQAVARRVDSVEITDAGVRLISGAEGIPLEDVIGITN